MRRGWALLAICLVILTSAAGQKPRAQVDLEKIAARDPRIEVVARAICAARGIDPDYKGFPYPPGQPVWETFIVEARDILAAEDAIEKPTQHKGPPY